MSETPHYDFTREPLKVKGKRPKITPDEVDLNRPETYLKEEYAKQHRVQEGLGDHAATDTEMRLAILNKELIEGYTKIYSGKTQAELQKILLNEAGKPWEKAAAQAVLHKRMAENDVVLDEVTQKNWPTGREEDEEEEA